MAKKIEYFYTIVKQEGLAGATRGKVPVALCNALEAGDGDVIEWEVSGGVVIGGHTLTKSERRDWEREHGPSRPAPKKSSAPVKSKGKGKKGSKPVVKSKGSKGKQEKLEKPTKKGKKGKTSSNRATKVSYEAPPKSTKKKKIQLPKKGKKGKR